MTPFERLLAFSCLHCYTDPHFEMRSLYQPSSLDTPDIKGKSQTHETAKATTSTESPRTATRGATAAQGREGGKKHKGVSQQHGRKDNLAGDLLQVDDGGDLLGGGDPSPPVEDGSSAPALESEEQTPE